MDRTMLIIAGMLLDDGHPDAFVDMVMAAHGWVGVTAAAARGWRVQHGEACRCGDCVQAPAPKLEVGQLSLF